MTTATKVNAMATNDVPTSQDSRASRGNGVAVVLAARVVEARAGTADGDEVVGATVVEDAAAPHRVTSPSRVRNL